MSDPIEPAKSYFQKTYENRYGKSSNEPIPDFARLWQDQILVHLDEKSTSYNLVRNCHVGDLYLPSGKLVACDPCDYPEPEENTFSQSVTPGQYPVYLTIVGMPFYGGTVALARVQFSEALPVEWKAGMDNDRGGFGTDMASGCFMDAGLAQQLQDQFENDDDNVREGIAFRLREYDKEHPDSYADIIVYDEVKGANIIAFTTGIGDGSYPCYCGFDAEGQLACALIDFWIHDIETAYDWSSTGFPPIPDGFDETFFKWVEAMIPHLKQPTVELQPLKPEGAAIFLDEEQQNLPNDVALYYKYLSPWSNVDDPQMFWQQALERIHSNETGNVIKYQLKPDVQFLPLAVRSLDSFDVAILTDDKYLLASIIKDPPQQWRDYPIIEAVFHQCDLRIYVLKRVLAGLKMNDQ